MMMSYLHTPTRTYTVVAILLILHVWINYVAVRVVVMKSLNRQRTTILWAAYSAFRNADGTNKVLKFNVCSLTLPHQGSRAKWT